MDRYIEVIEKYGKCVYNGYFVAEFSFGLKKYCIFYNEFFKPYRIQIL